MAIYLSANRTVYSGAMCASTVLSIRCHYCTNPHNCLETRIALHSCFIKENKFLTFKKRIKLLSKKADFISNLNNGLPSCRLASYLWILHY